MAKKVAAFFATDLGKSTAGILAITGTIGSALIQFLPNTIFKEQFRDILQLYKHSIPVPVPASVLEKLEQAKKDIQLSPKSHEITAYTTLGFDLDHIGCSKYKTGGMVGIPASFSYKTAKDIDKTNILVGFKTVHWSSPDGLALESSLLLSDAAQKFALAREIAILNSNQLTIDVGLSVAPIALYYYYTYVINRKWNLFARPLKFRVCLYTLLGGIIFTSWLFVKDFLAVRRDELADEEAASISPEYAEGALEFYNKILQRNIALRSLLGESGSSQFTALGNVREVLRTTHLPCVTRRDRAAARCQKLAQAKEEIASNPNV